MITFHNLTLFAGLQNLSSLSKTYCFWLTRQFYNLLQNLWNIKLYFLKDVKKGSITNQHKSLVWKGIFIKFLDCFMALLILNLTTTQDTIGLWSNSSRIRSEGWGFQSCRCQNLFQFKSTKISSQKSEQKKKGPLSLIASVRAVAVGEKRIQEKKEKEMEASF